MAPSTEFAERDVAFEHANQAGNATAERYSPVARVTYLSNLAQLAIEFASGVTVLIPTEAVQGLAGATADDLSDVEISPSGLGLHFPSLDADVYLPALVQGITGTRNWMAARMGAAGGQARSNKKAEAARENGRKGGRPPRSTQDRIAAEQAILGAVILDNSIMERLSDLAASEFYEPFHARLWQKIGFRIENGGLAEPIWLMEQFRRDPAFEALGGLRYLADLVDRAPRPERLPKLIGLLKASKS